MTIERGDYVEVFGLEAGIGYVLEITNDDYALVWRERETWFDIYACSHLRRLSLLEVVAVVANNAIDPLAFDVPGHQRTSAYARW